MAAGVLKAPGHRQREEFEANKASSRGGCRPGPSEPTRRGRGPQILCQALCSFCTPFPGLSARGLAFRVQHPEWVFVCTPGAGSEEPQWKCCPAMSPLDPGADGPGAQLVGTGPFRCPFSTQGLGASRLLMNRRNTLPPCVVGSQAGSGGGTSSVTSPARCFSLGFIFSPWDRFLPNCLSISD